MRYRRFYCRGKSGAATNDPSIVRFQSSSSLADLDRCQSRQHVRCSRSLPGVLRSFREATRRCAGLHAHWRGDRDYGPRLILSVLKRRFDAAIRLGTPDHDRFAGCVQRSGNGPGERAGTRRAKKCKQTNPAMAGFYTGLLDDLRILPNRSDAFEKLGATSEGLRRFGTMVSQSLQYGTPVSQALRSIAADLRRERMTKLEERAHKLGAKLTIPMVLFLLPAMFVILGGSPILHLVRSFASFGK